MRTTLTLEPDVARGIEEERHRTRQALKAVVNEALRRGLALAKKPQQRRPFRVQAHHCGLKPGVDLARLNQLYDQLEAEQFTVKTKAAGKRRSR